VTILGLAATVAAVVGILVAGSVIEHSTRATQPPFALLSLVVRPKFAAAAAAVGPNQHHSRLQKGHCCTEPWLCMVAGNMCFAVSSKVLQQ
jgi:hypothetical protein